MRFVRGFRTLAGLLAVVFIMTTVTMFIIFPRVANQLAETLGTGAEHPIHWLPAIILDVLILVLAYFWVWRPWRTFTYVQEGQGLVVQKGQGRAYIDAESVRHQVYAAVTKVSNVHQVEVAVDNELGRALVRANILTDNDINGPRKKQEINREIKKIVQDQFGVRLASEPIINLRLTPLEGVPPAPPLEPLPIRRDHGAAPAAVPAAAVVTSAPIIAEPAVLPKASPEPLQSGVNTSEPAPFKRRAFVADTPASTAPAIPSAPIRVPEPMPEPVVETVAMTTPPAAEPAPSSDDDAELAALMTQLNQSSSTVNTDSTPAVIELPASTIPDAEPKPSLDALATDTIANADSGSSDTDGHTDSSMTDHGNTATDQPFVRRRFLPPTEKSDNS